MEFEPILPEEEAEEAATAESLDEPEPPPVPLSVRAPTFLKSYRSWERIGVAHLL